MWTTEEAIQLCRAVEAICPSYGYHVALTGGLLYRDGARKDCDLVFYRIRQVPLNPQNQFALFDALRRGLGITATQKVGSFFVVKGEYKGKPVDFLFPDNPEGLY